MKTFCIHPIPKYTESFRREDKNEIKSKTIISIYGCVHVICIHLMKQIHPQVCEHARPVGKAGSFSERRRKRRRRRRRRGVKNEEKEASTLTTVFFMLLFKKRGKMMNRSTFVYALVCREREEGRVTSNDQL